MTNYVLIGSGKTDENGVAHLDTDANGDPLTHSYTGVGAGEIDVLASLDNPIVEGSIVSEPYNVFDCIQYDNGIGANNNYRDVWSGLSGSSPTATLTREPTHSVLKETGATNMISRVTNNDKSMELSFSDGVCFELDIKQVDGAYSNAIIDIRKVGDASKMTYFTSSSLGISDREWHHVKITAEDGNITAHLENGTTYNLVRPFDEFRFGLWGGTDITEIHFKNFKVYSI